MTTSVQTPTTIKSMVKFVTFSRMQGYKECLPTIRQTSNGYLKIVLSEPCTPILNEYGEVINGYFDILFSKNAVQDERVGLGVKLTTDLLKSLWVVDISKEDEAPHYKLCFKQEGIDLTSLYED